MAQSNYTIPNDSAPAVRTQMNAVFASIATNNSGSSSPTSTFPYQWWYDTTANTLKMRNGADSGWIDIALFDQTGGTFRILTTFASQAEAEAGTDNTKVMSPLRVAQTISALAPPETLSAAQATISGTAFDFLSIPAGANRVDVIFDEVSLSGVDNLLVRVGPAAGVVTTGYSSQSVALGGSNVGTSSTSGFVIIVSGAARGFTGTLRLRRVGGNTWVSDHNGEIQGLTAAVAGGGRIALAGPLDRIRVTRTGSNTFDAGQVSILIR